MFTSSRRNSHRSSFQQNRISKSSSKKAPSFRGSTTSQVYEKIAQTKPQSNRVTSPPLSADLITFRIGPSQRLFAAHEDILQQVPYFQELCVRHRRSSGGIRIDIPDEEPEVFSSVLEFLYKGDYTPRAEYNDRTGKWQIEDHNSGSVESTIFHNTVGRELLKDTVIYCSAHRYGLPELKNIALRKQGLQPGAQCSTILHSARFAYEHTPDDESRLRAHYLTLIIRSRHTFKRSGTMQMEMEEGGKMWFDLFVSMVRHLDDVVAEQAAR